MFLIYRAAMFLIYRATEAPKIEEEGPILSPELSIEQKFLNNYTALKNYFETQFPSDNLKFKDEEEEEEENLIYSYDIFLRMELAYINKFGFDNKNFIFFKNESFANKIKEQSEKTNSPEIFKDIIKSMEIERNSISPYNQEATILIGLILIEFAFFITYFTMRILKKYEIEKKYKRSREAIQRALIKKKKNKLI
jgi:hypothetical protein